MIQLLKDLRDKVNEGENVKIDDILRGTADDISTVASTLKIAPAKRRRSPDSDDEHDKDGEALASGSVSSNQDLDILDEDLHKDEESRAAGFHGKNSEVQWLRSLKGRLQRAGGEPRRQPLRTSRHPQVSSTNIYLDKENVEINDLVDPFELPPIETAQRLLSSYMDTVQDSFPILSKKSFENQFHTYYESVRQLRQNIVPERWQATLNLVFAIGANYSHLVKAQWRGDSHDYLLYQAQARMLEFKEHTLISPPDLSLIKITGLLAFYYQSIGHVNRAWIVIGISIRFAQALGLHVRNEDPNASTVKKESLVRTWWGLHTLERLLSTITGRPSVFLDNYCSVPLPLSLSEDQFSEATVAARYKDRLHLNSSNLDPSSGMSTSTPSSSSPSITDSSTRTLLPANSGSFLEARIKIGIIAQKLLFELYSPGTNTNSWESVQQKMPSLAEELDQWALSLPNGADIT
ncbi:fungal-specific transcription factor domain-containing protein [Phaeosphaeriaceae sp. PMI808]|nr:fungal-specific transcription factor domain-containing protein [Phaeosphaeriaceae sp. PMI808]